MTDFTTDTFTTDTTECVMILRDTLRFTTKSNALNLIDAAVWLLEEDAQTIKDALRRSPGASWDVISRLWQFRARDVRTHLNFLRSQCTQAESDRYLRPRVDRVVEAVDAAAALILDELREGDVLDDIVRDIAIKTRAWGADF